MGITEILFISIGLSMDAFAVSLTSGFTVRKLKFIFMLKIALCFGIFQALMPFIGWIAAKLFGGVFISYDRYIALLLLSYVGVKMIYDSLTDDKEQKKAVKEDINIISLIILGIATSIDALMIGTTFSTSFTGYGIMFPISVIGLTTFMICFAGVWFGKIFGDMLGGKAQISGGIILIAIGLKIFFFR